MNKKTYYQQALLSLCSAKLRSMLAVLGILVGTAAVVALISCGNLATEKALEQFKTMGTDLMALSMFSPNAKNTSGGDTEFTLAQWRRLAKQIPQIRQIAPYSTAYQKISYHGHALKGSVIGADSQLASILALQLAKGRFVADQEQYEHVAVIGHQMAEEMKTVSLDSPVGRQIRVGSNLYTVVGQLAPWKDNAFFNEDINNALIIPIRGMLLLSKDSSIHHGILKLKQEIPVQETVKAIRHMIKIQAPRLQVYPRSARQIIEGMENQGRIFTLLLAVIGGISLLVGGIGIMNVMLVSVAERKKEIGIRKAIGARQRDIQALFLSEAVILGLTGGGSGVLLGILLTAIIAAFNHWPLHFYLFPVLAGLCTSLVTCIFFAYYPARRAAKLPAVQSLAQE